MSLTRDELTHCLELVETRFDLINSIPPDTDDIINESYQLLDLKIKLEMEVINTHD